MNKDDFLKNIKYIIKCNGILQKNYKRRIIEITINTDFFNKDFMIGDNCKTFDGGQDYLSYYTDMHDLKMLDVALDAKYSFVLRLQNDDEIILYTDNYVVKDLNSEGDKI